MRCPKCKYLSFEPEPRCKNCGYDLSFAPADLALDFDRGTDNPAADLALHDVVVRPGVLDPRSDIDLGPVPAPAARDGAPEERRAPAAPSPAPVSSALERDVAPDSAPPLSLVGGRASRPAAVAAAAPSASAPASRMVPGFGGRSSAAPATATLELPLFVQGLREQEEPLVKMPPQPRAPLSVRRSTPEPARVRAKYSRGPAAAIEPSLLDDVPGTGAPNAAAARQAAGPPSVASAPAVGAGPRLTAALIDVLLLGGIDAAVVLLTLYSCGLPRTDLLRLPLAPLLAFLLLIDGGYLTLFTAACGQTIGKMAAEIRVANTAGVDGASGVGLGQAVVRALATFLSIVPLGGGFLMSLGGAGLALHDRLAHTRVVSQ